MRGTARCHWAVPGRCSLRRAQPPPQGWHRKARASPSPHRAPARPGAGASGGTPPSPQTSGEGRLRAAQTLAPPRSPCRGVRMQTHPRWAPNTRPAPAFGIPRSRGDKGAQEELPGAGARSPRGPSSEREARDRAVPKGCEATAPQLGDPRDTHRCAAPGLAGAQRAGSSGALHASGPTSTSLGPRRRRKLGRQPRPRARSPRRGGAAGSPLRGAGTPAPRSTGRGGPPPASGCGEPGALCRRGES